MPSVTAVSPVWPSEMWAWTSSGHSFRALAGSTVFPEGSRGSRPQTSIGVLSRFLSKVSLFCYFQTLFCHFQTIPLTDSFPFKLCWNLLCVRSLQVLSGWSQGQKRSWLLKWWFLPRDSSTAFLSPHVVRLPKPLPQRGCPRPPWIISTPRSCHTPSP